jgi:hypothetical protein
MPTCKNPLKLILLTFVLAACRESVTPMAPPTVHDARGELLAIRQGGRDGDFILEPRLAGCYHVEVSRVGGSFPYTWLPNSVELSRNDSRCCAPGSGRYSVGWNVDSGTDFLGGSWSEARNGDVRIAFGYGGVLAFELRRDGDHLVGSATNDSPVRGHSKIHPPVTLSPMPCDGLEFRFEPVSTND